MTTIATDGRCVAFDGRATAYSKLRSDKAVKAVEVAPGIIAAGAGMYDDAHAFMKWARDSLHNVKVDEPNLGEDFAGILVDTIKGVCAYYSQKLFPMETLLPFAIGSGDELAIGAMLAGKHPIDAVKIACGRDIGSGGAVICLPASMAEAHAWAAAFDKDPESPVDMALMQLFNSLGEYPKEALEHEVGVIEYALIPKAVHDHTMKLYDRVGALIKSAKENDGRPVKDRPGPTEHA